MAVNCRANPTAMEPAAGETVMAWSLGSMTFTTAEPEMPLPGSVAVIATGPPFLTPRPKPEESTSAMARSEELQVAPRSVPVVESAKRATALNAVVSATDSSTE